VLAAVPSTKSLRGVAHNLAHHAQSGLAFLYPHLWRACSDVGVRQAHLDLLSQAPYPVGLPYREPLAMALHTLRGRFLDILDKGGFAASDVSSVELVFEFPPEGDGSIYSVRAVLTAMNGRDYTATVR